jgi:hypothetical protein
LNIDDDVRQRAPYKRWVFVLFACLTLLNTAWITIHMVIHMAVALHNQPANSALSVPPTSMPVQNQPVVAAAQSQPNTNAAAPQPTNPTAQSSSGDSSAQNQPADASNTTYTAIISCGASGFSNINALACFAGEPSTQIELTNGGNYGLYQSYQISSLGTTTARGLEIRLRHSFQLKAQNAAPHLILGVQIINNQTGEQMFGKQVAQFGVIDISN